jgi:hypothetical protein
MSRREKPPELKIEDMIDLVRLRKPDHQQIEGKHRELMNRLAGALDEMFEGYGFCLLVFPFADKEGEMDGRMNYISNAERKDMLVAMKEFIARNEGRVPGAPKGKQ